MKFKSIYITKNDIPYSIFDEKGYDYRSSYSDEKYMPLVSMDIYGSTTDVIKTNFVGEQKKYLEKYDHFIGTIRGTIFLLNEFDQDGGVPAKLLQQTSGDYYRMYNVLGREGYIADKERKLYKNFFYLHDFEIEGNLEKEEVLKIFDLIPQLLLELYHLRVRTIAYMIPPIDDYFQFISRMPHEDPVEENSEEPYPAEFMKKEAVEFMTTLGFKEIGKSKIMMREI